MSCLLLAVLEAPAQQGDNTAAGNTNKDRQEQQASVDDSKSKFSQRGTH